MFASSNYNKNLVEKNNFNAAIYVRLSKEDDASSESESIINQKKMLEKYAIDNSWNIIDIYSDDGYSGGNFDRPDFLRMKKDIESGIVNLVLVKDLSRLGRDYIDTGHYYERYFPEHNVRLISVADGIDTFSDNTNNDMTPFKAVFNDMFLKDTSNKIKSSFKIKKENGDFIGAFAPYGYCKSKENKNRFVIDENVSEIVKRIFNLYINGTSMVKIAAELNLDKIPSPCEYKYKTGNYKNVNVKFYIWRNETIKRILTNPVYIGTMVQGKAEKINYKSKKHRKIPRQYWSLKENMHEPIIDKKTFDIVQKMIEKKASKICNVKKVDHLLGGFLECGDCKFPITFRRNEKKNFITLCSNNSRFQRCTRHSILEETINNAVIEDLKNISNKKIKKKEFLSEFKNASTKPTSEYQKEIEKYKSKLEVIKKIIKNLYEDKTRGVITEEEFGDLLLEYREERESINNNLEKLIHNIEKEKEFESDDAKFYEILSKIIDFEEIEKYILVQLINKVEIFDTKEIKIHYNFVKP